MDINTHNVNQVASLNQSINKANAVEATMKQQLRAEIKPETKTPGFVVDNAPKATVTENERALQQESKDEEQLAEIEQVTEDLTALMSVMRKGLEFKIDDSLGQQVVSVMDIDTGELIRQIPNEEALELAIKLHEVTGLLMTTEV